EGAKLAVKELKEKGVPVELIVEDDQSVTKNTVNAYVKLKNTNKVEGIIGGSWWLNAIVKQAEKDKIPLLSCETVYNKDVVEGQNYFILNGDLRTWIRVYEPLLERLNPKSGAMVKYVS